MKRGLHYHLRLNFVIIKTWLKHHHNPPPQKKRAQKPSCLFVKILNVLFKDRADSFPGHGKNWFRVCWGLLPMCLGIRLPHALGKLFKTKLVHVQVGIMIVLYWGLRDQWINSALSKLNIVNHAVIVLLGSSVCVSTSLSNSSLFMLAKWIPFCPGQPETYKIYKMPVV